MNSPENAPRVIFCDTAAHLAEVVSALIDHGVHFECIRIGGRWVIGIN